MNDDTDAPRLGFVCTETQLGTLLVAASARGVCLVWLGDSRADGLDRLETALPFAERVEQRIDARVPVARWAHAIRASVEGRSTSLDVPLDVRGSAFERRVWAALRAIPRGETRSYAEVARAIGSPRGARAVANACASNPTPLVTPCHRVVRSDGASGGFALGHARKRQLLRQEGALAAASAGGEPETGPTQPSASSGSSHALW